jgi:hypothetical protein
MEHYQEKFNKLDAEIKDQKLIDRTSKFVLEDRDILEIVEPTCLNFAIACKIEQLIKKHRYTIVCLDPLQIDVEIDNENYSICGHVDNRQIVHLVISKAVNHGTSDNYVHRLNDHDRLKIKGNFLVYSELVIDVHKSQLEQAIIEALDALQRKDVDYN